MPEYLTIDHLSLKEIARIFSNIRVDSVTECWEWQLQLNRGGYGKITFRGRTEIIHRLLYAWLVQPIPRRQKGKKTPQIDHLVCDNPPCCNPAHTMLVPPRMNSLRSLKAPAAVNARKTHCIRGHLLGTEPSGNGSYGRECRTCKNERRNNQPEAQRQHRREQVALNYQQRKSGPNREEFLKRKAEILRDFHSRHPGYNRKHLRERKEGQRAKVSQT